MAYDIGPKIGIEGESAFRKSIRDINASLKAMTSEMKAVTSAYAAGDQSQEKLRKQNELLNRQVEVQKTKLSELSAMLEKSKAKYGETDEKTQKWQRAVNEATAELNRLDNELKDNVGALQRADEANTEFARAQRRAEEAAEQLRQEQERLASQVAHTSDKLQNSSEALNTVNKTALAASAALAGLGLATGKVGADFEAQMSRVASISGASAEQIEALNEAAKEMGETTQFSATESGKALEYMAMAGWKTEQMVDGLSGVMNLAAASGEELGTVSDIVTDALTAFGLKASDSAHFADVLARASSSANTNVSMMGETFKYAAPVAGSLGYNVEDVAVAIGLMANAGIKGEKSGTALRGMLTNLAKPSRQNSEYMEKLRISMTDASGEVKPLNKLLSEMRDKFKKLTEAQKAEYAAGIAGKEAMSGMLALVNSSDADFKKLTNAINNSNGAAEEMAKTANDNLKGELKLLGSAAEGVGIAFYEKFEKQASGAVEKLTKKVSKFSRDLSSGELDNELKAIASTAAGAGVALVALNTSLAVKDVQNFMTAMRSGKAAMDAYKSATIAGTLAQKAYNLSLLATPWGWAAIAAGAAATALITYQAMAHESTSTTEMLSDEIKELNRDLEEQVERQNELAESRAESLGEVDREINLIGSYVDELENLTDENGRVNDKYKERASYLAEQVNNLIPDAIKITEDEAGAYYKVSDAIDDMLFHKKKEMALAAWEEEYKDALKNRAEAVDKWREASEKQAEAEEEVNRIRQEALSATGQELLNLKMEQAEAERVLRESIKTTDEAQESLDRYNQVTAANNAVVLAKDIDQLNVATAGFSDTLVKATGDNRAELEKGLADSKANLDLLVGQYGAAYDKMTEAQRKAAEDQISEQSARLDQQIIEAKRGGIELPESFGKGVTEGSPVFSDAMMDMFNKNKSTLEAAGVDLETVGYGYDVYLKRGIESGSEEVKEAAEDVGSEAISGANAKANEAQGIGENFARGFSGGISSNLMLNLAWDSAWKMAGEAVRAAKKRLDEHSPSRVMKKVGSYASEGFAIGIEDGITYARKAANKLGDAIVSEIADLNEELAEMQEKEREEQAEKELEDYEKAIAKKYEELESAEKKEKQKVLDEIAKLQTDWNDKQVKAEQDAAKEALKSKISALEDFKKEYDTAMSELEREQQTMVDKLSGYGDLFETMKDKRGRELLKIGDLQEDIDKIKEYGDALEELKTRGISESLMDEITSMPIDDAINYTTELLKKTPKEYDKYMELWEEKQREAEQVAKKFYQDEFDHLQKDFVDKVPSELSKLKSEMYGIGKNSAVGLAEGFWSKKSYITMTFQNVLQKSLQEARDFLDINSPSKKWGELGMYSAQGYGVGFTDQMKDVAKQISNSIPVSVETNTAAATTTKAVEGMVNGLAPLLSANQQGTSPININLVMPDGRKLASVLIDPFKDEARRRGVSLT